MICPDAFAFAAACNLPASLVSPQALARVERAVAVALAPGAAAGHILEVRPGEKHGRVDLSHVYLAASGGLERLAASPRAPARIRCLAAGAEALGMRVVWLERDLDGEEGTPSVFVAPPDPFARTSELSYFARRTLAILQAPAAQVNATAEALERLPPDTGLRQLGVMFPRQPSVVRLVIKCKGPDQIHGLLDRIGWPGDSTAATALVAHPAFERAEISADLDVLDRLRASIGFELSCLSLSPARVGRAIAAFARDALVSAAAAEDLSALAAPVRLSAPPELEGRLELRLNHLKAQLGEGGDVSVKAYLSLVVTPDFAMSDRTSS